MEIIKVDWIDAVTEYLSEGISLEEIDEERFGVLEVSSVGYLIKETKDVIILGNVCVRNETIFKNVHTIPKKYILRIERLNKKQKRSKK